MLEDYLKNLREKLSYLDLITYFLANFKRIHKVDDFISEFQSKVFDVTNTPERHIIRSPEGSHSFIWFREAEESYPGHQSYFFIFQEDNTFSGVFDLNFINDNLANLRAQLFAKGFFTSGKMNKKYDSVLDFLTDKCGEGYGSVFDFLKDKYGEGIDSLPKALKYVGIDGLFGQIKSKTWYDEKQGLVITLLRLRGGPKPSVSLTIVNERFV